MPRVLLTGFCAVPGPRRAGVQLRHVIRALTPLHSLDVLVAREGEQAYVERQGTVRVLRVPTSDADVPAQIQAFQRALRRQLDGADYDIVHCRDRWSARPVLEARDRLGYAVVYDLTRSPLGEHVAEGDAREDEELIRKADLVLAPNPAAVKLVAAQGRPERVWLAPPGVDIDRFDWEAPPVSAVPRILYTGSIDPSRGLRVLLRATANLVRGGRDVRLALAGSLEPTFAAHLDTMILELGLGAVVERLGTIEHEALPTVLATATVCVVPGAAAGAMLGLYPTKLLEYMACRRAIVAPRRDAVAAVLENGREALLFEPDDPIDLARKLERLLDEPVLRDRLAENAYERVRRDFTASAARRSIRAAYTALVERFAIEAPVEAAEDEAKVELLDDDLEATVFEEEPGRADTAIEQIGSLTGTLEALEDDQTGGRPSASATSADETSERGVVEPPRSATLVAARSSSDDWVVSALGEGLRVFDEETGTIEAAPIDATDGEGADRTRTTESVAAVETTSAHPALANVGSFVAGEIEVPAPSNGAERDRDPAVHFTAAGELLGRPGSDL